MKLYTRGAFVEATDDDLAALEMVRCIEFCNTIIGRLYVVMWHMMPGEEWALLVASERGWVEYEQPRVKRGAHGWHTTGGGRALLATREEIPPTP
jgi:hypothetical protein